MKFCKKLPNLSLTQLIHLTWKAALACHFCGYDWQIAGEFHFLVQVCSLPVIELTEKWYALQSWYMAEGNW